MLFVYEQNKMMMMILYYSKLNKLSRHK